MRSKMAVLLALVAFGGLTAPAQAAGLWVQFDNNVDNFKATFFGTLKTYQARQYEGWLSATDDDTQNGESLGNIYCVDLYGHVPGNPSEYEVNDKIDDSTGWASNNVGRTNFDRVFWLINNYGDAATDGAQRHGLQAAIWAVAYEGNFVYQSGLSAAAKTAFDTYLAASVGQSATSSRWLNSKRDEEQDMGTPTNPVPEPGSMLLLGTGLLGFGIARFRRKK